MTVTKLLTKTRLLLITRSSIVAALCSCSGYQFRQIAKLRLWMVPSRCNTSPGDFSYPCDCTAHFETKERKPPDRHAQSKKIGL